MPLGEPVVPLVWQIHAASSSASAIDRLSGELAARRSSYRGWSANATSTSAPSSMTTIARIGSRSATAARVPVNDASTKSARSRACAMSCTTCSGRSRAFTGCTTRPAQGTPSISSTWRWLFQANVATGLPDGTPSASRAPPTSCARRPTSRQVRRSSPGDRAGYDLDRGSELERTAQNQIERERKPLHQALHVCSRQRIGAVPHPNIRLPDYLRWGRRRDVDRCRAHAAVVLAGEVLVPAPSGMVERPVLDHSTDLRYRNARREAVFEPPRPRLGDGGEMSLGTVQKRHEPFSF